MLHLDIFQTSCWRIDELVEKLLGMIIGEKDGLLGEAVTPFIDGVRTMVTEFESPVSLLILAKRLVGSYKHGSWRKMQRFGVRRG